MIKWISRKGKKKPPKHDEHTTDYPLPGGPGLGAVGATGGNLTQYRLSPMKIPWRKLEDNEEWTKKHAVKLLGDIQKHCVNEKKHFKHSHFASGIGRGWKIKIFVNTVASIDRERISQITIAGGADGSLTFALKEYRPQHKLKNFRILDTMGVEDNDQGGLNLKDVLYLVKGHIPPNYKFNPATPIDEGTKEFRSEPKDKEKIHCVVFVIDATVAGNDNISDARRKKIKELQIELKALDMPRIVLITKIDVLCEFVDGNIENTYKSEKVKEAVRVARELYKVPEHCIFPVENYESEVQSDYKKEILHLLALRQMIYFGTDFLNSVSTSTSDDEAP